VSDQRQLARCHHYVCYEKEAVMKVLACKDVGFDCEYSVIGITTGDVLRSIGEHAITYHGLMEITTADNNAWLAKIHDVPLSEFHRVQGSE